MLQFLSATSPPISKIHLNIWSEAPGKTQTSNSPTNQHTRHLQTRVVHWQLVYSHKNAFASSKATRRVREALISSSATCNLLLWQHLFRCSQQNTQVQSTAVIDNRNKKKGEQKRLSPCQDDQQDTPHKGTWQKRLSRSARGRCKQETNLTRKKLTARKRITSRLKEEDKQAPTLKKHCWPKFEKLPQEVSQEEEKGDNTRTKGE